MKYAKKLLAFLLTLAMLLSLSITAFAESYVYGGEGPLGGGSITIDNAVEGHEYRIYQILYLESYYLDNENHDNSRYVYKVNSSWDEFVNRYGIRDRFLHIDDQGYVTWIMKDEEGNDTGAYEFARLAGEYIKDHEDLAVGVGFAVNDGQITFKDLKLGYYLVDSTVGSVCTLITTRSPDIGLWDKNRVPINEKEVQEDDNIEYSDYYGYGSVNDADIGQKVNFKSVITIPPGSENVVFHDTMSSGLELWDPEWSIKVYCDVEMIQELDPNSYTVNLSPGDGCAFEISFKQEYLDRLTLSAETAQLYVKYTARLTQNAVIGGEGNDNTSYLSYGEEGHMQTTPPSITKTYTWNFDVLKYANGDKSKVLEGAEFELLNYDKTEFAVFHDDGKFWDWVSFSHVLEGESELTEFPGARLTTNDQGKIEIAGLDSGTYYLREIKAPDGYNKQAEDTEIVIELDISYDADHCANALTQIPVTAEINNQSGTELPSTGGMGTTIFYMVGSVLLVGAAVLLITKKRVSAAE